MFIHRALRREKQLVGIDVQKPADLSLPRQLYRVRRIQDLTRHHLAVDEAGIGLVFR